jgi:hypothetical protein
MPTRVSNGHISRANHFNPNFKSKTHPSTHFSRPDRPAPFQHRPVETAPPVKARLQREIQHRQQIIESQMPKEKLAAIRQRLLSGQMAVFAITPSGEISLLDVEDLTFCVSEDQLLQVPAMLGGVLFEKLLGYLVSPP